MPPEKTFLLAEKKIGKLTKFFPVFLMMDIDILQLVIEHTPTGAWLALAFVCHLFPEAVKRANGAHNMPQVALSSLERIKWAKSLPLLPRSLEKWVYFDNVTDMTMSNDIDLFIYLRHYCGIAWKEMNVRYKLSARDRRQYSYLFHRRISLYLMLCCCQFGRVAFLKIMEEELYDFAKKDLRMLEACMGTCIDYCQFDALLWLNEYQKCLPMEILYIDQIQYAAGYCSFTESGPPARLGANVAALEWFYSHKWPVSMDGLELEDNGEGIIGYVAIKWFVAKGISKDRWLRESFCFNDRVLLQDLIKLGAEYDWDHDEYDWYVDDGYWSEDTFFEFLIKNGHPFPPEGHVLRTLIKDHFGLEP